MTSAFCPAHITCFFTPAASENTLERGSRGVGVRLSLGTTVHADEITGRTKVLINGKADGARITRHVLEHMAPDRNFEVNAECGLPLGQGFGMSASGAVAAALCLSDITGKSRKEAFEAAHTAEVVCGGGLGDVAGLMHEGDVPIRIKAGLPPIGSVIDRGIVFERMTLVVLGRKLSTAGVLGDDERLRVICDAGDAAMGAFLTNGTKERLFEISGRFSAEAGVRGREVAEAMNILEGNGIRSSMCMLGNSIFTDVSDKDVEEILGDGNRMFSASSTGEPARIIRKA
ncbi:MAG: pantothenate kinase [Methanomassiliicoccaceae archaeon]|nr:pantothenate kinase [Methanomassiliicoccaceae archaeon]MCL2145634.1 pantothenate kinase [Methanomassiliicoccaceae archaeon]